MLIDPSSSAAFSAGPQAPHANTVSHADIFPGDHGDSLALKTFVATATRRKALLTSAFLVPLAGSVLLAFALPTTYESEARLLALIGQEYVFHSEIGDAGTGMALDAPAITKSEAEILQSRSLQEAVINAIGPTVLYPELADQRPSRLAAWAAPAIATAGAKLRELDDSTGLSARLEALGMAWPASKAADPAALSRPPTIAEKALTTFAERLTVEPVKNSSVIRIAFRHPDREMATNALKKLVDSYFARRIEILGRAQATALAGPYEEAESRLHAAEVKLDQFKQKHGVIDLSHELALVLQQRAAIEDSYRRAQSDLAQSRERLGALRKVLAATPRDITLYAQNELLDSYQKTAASLSQLEAERARRITTLYETHPDVVALDRQITRLREQQAKAPQAGQMRRVGVNPIHEQTTQQISETGAQMAALEAMVKATAAQRSELEARATSLRDIERQHRELVTERDRLLDNHKVYAKRFEDARILDLLGRDRNDNVRLIQAPLPPVEGHSPFALVIALGTVAGLIFSLLMAFLLEIMRTVFVIPQDAARTLGLPVLASVPVVKRPGLHPTNIRPHNAQPGSPSSPLRTTGANVVLADADALAADRPEYA